MRKTLILLAALCCTTSISATEYHVGAKKGKDSNNGSAKAPFATISKAAQVAQAGDTITVGEGIYREWIDPAKGGTDNNTRITYRAADGQQVQIKGSEVITGWINIEGSLWRVDLDTAFFKGFNSLNTLIEGDWFYDHGRVHHTGDIYLNGKSLYEVESLDKVKTPVARPDALDPKGELLAWYTTTQGGKTTIWANFQGANPNKELTEVSVRPTCFYPTQQGINYITITGFDISQAASQWGAPTAHQVGMIATHWNKGWIIEKNRIHDTKCSGITLGKEQSTGHNVWSKDPSKDGSLHYIEVTMNTLRHGWNRDNIGSHIVQNNVIYNCEQTGMCGSQGAAFSLIENNHIYNIWTKRQFSGAEIGGIKFHAAIDTRIRNNRINSAGRGIWLDWMTQGTRVSSNILYDNSMEDLFLEVNHGPFMVDNNIMLSNVSLSLQSDGGAYINNLFAGQTVLRDDFNRYTPYHLPHSTEVMGLSIIASGDDRIFNNIYVGFAPDTTTATKRLFGTISYDQARQKLHMRGNVYLRGATPSKADSSSHYAPTFDPQVKLTDNGNTLNLQITIPEEALQTRRQIITTDLLPRTILTQQSFEQPDGSPYHLDTDINGDKRSQGNVGPFSNIRSGAQSITIWKSN